MAIRHRKLLTFPIPPDNATDICGQSCDPVKNPDGICPFLCSPLCPSRCRVIVFSLLPSPPLPLQPPYFPSSSYLPPTHHRQELSAPLKVSVSLLIALLFFVLVTALGFWCKSLHRERNRDTHQHEVLGQSRGPVVDHPIWQIRTVGLQPSVIDAIASVGYRRGDGLVEETECSVCLNEFQEDESLRLLPKCNHAFHVACIDTWLASHTNCPLCRAQIVASPVNCPPPLWEQDSGNSSAGEGTRAENSENDGDSWLDRGGNASGLRDGAEEACCRPKLEVGSSESLTGSTVSFDSVSSARIRAAIASFSRGQSAIDAGNLMIKASNDP